MTDRVKASRRAESAFCSPEHRSEMFRDAPHAISDEPDRNCREEVMWFGTADQAGPTGNAPAVFTVRSGALAGAGMTTRVRHDQTGG